MIKENEKLLANILCPIDEIGIITKAQLMLGFKIKSLKKIKETTENVSLVCACGGEFYGLNFYISNKGNFYAKQDGGNLYRIEKEKTKEGNIKPVSAFEIKLTEQEKNVLKDLLLHVLKPKQSLCIMQDFEEGKGREVLEKILNLTL